VSSREKEECTLFLHAQCVSGETSSVVAVLLLGRTSEQTFDITVSGYFIAAARGQLHFGRFVNSV